MGAEQCSRRAGQRTPEQRDPLLVSPGTEGMHSGSSRPFPRTPPAGGATTPVGGDISPSMRDGCCGHNIEVTKSTIELHDGLRKRESISTLTFRPRRGVAQTVPSALERSNCGGRSASRLERADQGWGSLIGPMDFANAARSLAGTFGVTDVAPSGAFLDACTCWKTRLAMNSRNGV